LLTTGIDAPTVKNVVLFRLINSMTDFKQIIGRGTRVREDYGKLFFTILDYTGSATRNFADPAFDGEPVKTTEEYITADGTEEISKIAENGEPYEFDEGPIIHWHDDEPEPRKFYLSNGVAGEVLHELV